MSLARIADPAIGASPLVVDLEGTLLRSDLLLETAVAFIRGRPWHLFQALVWFMRGKAVLAEHLAEATDIDVSVLPYDPAVIERIAAARENGRAVVLATSSHQALAERIAGYLQLDRVVPTRNAAHAAHSNPSGIKDWARALRLHQWVKNALLFVPLLAAHQATNLVLLWQGALAFLFFGMCASSVYLLNDLIDLEDDRHHLSKRNRPFASGSLPIRSGLIALPLLLVGAFAGALWLLPWKFAAVLGAYYALTLSYSLWLKRRMAPLDVIALAMLYTIRVIAGGAVFQLPLTFWLLAFSTFMFLSLALAKRHAELRDALRRGRTGKARGRDYDPSDLEMISALGAASGYQSVMVLALYVRDQGTVALYAHPEIIWLACPLLLFWITRVWMLTHRGRMHDDPMVFAVSDRISQVVGALFCLVFFAAT